MQSEYLKTTVFRRKIGNHRFSKECGLQKVLRPGLSWTVHNEIQALHMSKHKGTSEPATTPAVLHDLYNLKRRTVCLDHILEDGAQTRAWTLKKQVVIASCSEMLVKYLACKNNL